MWPDRQEVAFTPLPLNLGRPVSSSPEAPMPPGSLRLRKRSGGEMGELEIHGQHQLPAVRANGLHTLPDLSLGMNDPA